MHLSKKQIILLVFFIVLLFALPAAVFLVQKRQDIRPRALQGRANLLMSSDKNSAAVGESINVLVTMQLVGSDLRVSGVDFMILYDREKLDVINITPTLQNVTAGGFFTEAPVVTSGGKFDDTYNFLRVVELAKMPDSNLPIGSVMLANITFRSVGEGSAVVKFPEDNKYIEIVGLGMMPPAGPSGLVGWWKMESDGDVVAQQLNSQSMEKQPETAEDYAAKYPLNNFSGVMVNKQDENSLYIAGTVDSVNVEKYNLRLRMDLSMSEKERIKNKQNISEIQKPNYLTINFTPSTMINDTSNNNLQAGTDKDNLKKLLFSFLERYVIIQATIDDYGEPAALVISRSYVQ